MPVIDGEGIRGGVIPGIIDCLVGVTFYYDRCIPLLRPIPTLPVTGDSRPLPLPFATTTPFPYPVRNFDYTLPWAGWRRPEHQTLEHRWTFPIPTHAIPRPVGGMGAPVPCTCPGLYPPSTFPIPLPHSLPVVMRILLPSPAVTVELGALPSTCRVILPILPRCAVDLPSSTFPTCRVERILVPVWCPYVLPRHTFPYRLFLRCMTDYPFGDPTPTTVVVQNLRYPPPPPQIVRHSGFVLRDVTRPYLPAALHSDYDGA